MRRIRVIPVLLIQNGGLVKSIKFKQHKYVGDPINAVRIFNDKEVDEIVILDISASKEKRSPNIAQIADIAGEAFMPLAYGGGITSIEQVKQILFNGAEKVIMNTSALDNPKLITETANQFGNQSIVVSIDAKKNWLGQYKVYRDCGTQSTSFSPETLASQAEALGAGEIFLTSIDQDGTFGGFDLTLVERVANAINIPVIACGGAAEVAHFPQAVHKGASAIAASSMFVFQRPHRAVLISYPTQQELNEQLFELL
ncbi:AglZ/HisF2 family acetamidino modification protein [Haliscomenobacter sp.]|uniref:AglZ/HisF2 family acetamidino modification protein n=1 Tax=Haliscomenobacter sp. TaxID=2717303 RepID=UPI003BA8BD57